MMRPREDRMMYGSARFGGRAGRSVRSGPRLDMTPLADVAFLLLTFFTCATALLCPNVIEIAVPPG